MADPILTRFAQTVARYSLDLREGDIFLIRATPLAIPLVKEVYREAVAIGAHVSYRLTFDGESEIFYRDASEVQLDFVSPVERLEVETLTARLQIQAPYNTRSNAGVDPLRQARHMRSQSDLIRRHRERSAAGEVRWCGTLFPTQALAQEAGMSLGQYEEFVYRAMFLDHEDPPAAWRAFSAEQQKRVDLLNRVRTLRIVAVDTDLTLSVAGRTWINSDGRRNFPSGEVFTGPVEDSANGIIRFTYPAIRGGREVEDVRLRFENGRVTDARAAKNLDYLLAELDTDAGARFLGEVAIGNNYGIAQFTRNTLFDEKIGGTCHLALGASYPETGGCNDSAIHWDMVCDLRQGGEIYADGALIHKDGRWIV